MYLVKNTYVLRENKYVDHIIPSTIMLLYDGVYFIVCCILEYNVCFLSAKYFIIIIFIMTFTSCKDQHNACTCWITCLCGINLCKTYLQLWKAGILNSPLLCFCHTDLDCYILWYFLSCNVKINTCIYKPKTISLKVFSSPEIGQVPFCCVIFTTHP